MSLNLKIISLSGVKYDKNIYSVTVKAADGLMQIIKNYGYIIEEIRNAKIKIRETADNSSETIFYEISDGWLINKNNCCQIFITTINKVK